MHTHRCFLRSFSRLAPAAFAVFAIATATAHAQVCGQWVGEGSPSGLWPMETGTDVIGGPVPGGAPADRTVWLASVHWDPAQRLRYLSGGSLVNDPLPDEDPGTISNIEPWGSDLVVTTNNQSCGILPPCGPHTNRVHLRSASGWTSLGSPGRGFVYDTCVYNNTLYAGGFREDSNFSTTYAAVWRWDGAAWQLVGTDTGQSGAVGTMAVFAGSLWVGGTFANIGGIAGSAHLAAFDGSVWSPPPSGTTTGNVNGITSWSPGSLGGFPQLIVSGSFTGAGSIASPNIIALNVVGDLNGNFWEAMGTGLQGGYAQSFANISVTFNNNDLLVTGSFTGAGGVASTGRIARWTGGAWQSYGGSASGGVGDIGVVNGQFYITGPFQTVEGVATPGLARYISGTGWRPVVIGNNGPIFDEVFIGSDLYAAGDFTQIGGIDASHIARRDALGNWSALGSGINGHVDCLAVYNGQLYAGGTFTLAGGGAATNIARWTGAAWQALGSGVAGNVLDMQVWNNELYVAGDFLTAGGAATQRVARWNGASWTAMPGALNGVARCLAVHNNELYVGGDFTFGGVGAGQAMLRVARWLSPTSWVPIDTITGVGAPVRDMTSWNGHLYLGGDFTGTSALSSNKVIRWNSASHWSAVGPAGSRDFIDVKAMEVIDNTVLVVGNATLTAFDGTNWTTPYTTQDTSNSGTSGQDGLIGQNIYCAEKSPLASDIFFGGDFMDLDYNYQCSLLGCGQPTPPSAYLERWSYAPVVLQPTGGGAFCPGAPLIQLTAQIDGRVIGSSTAFQWKRNGTTINDGTDYSGTTNYILWVQTFDAAHAGAYTCVASNSCGFMESPPAVLSVATGCPGTCDSIDFNNDGLFPDTTDIDDMLSVFSGGPCSNDPLCSDIDFNNDGLFPDTLDIDSLLSVFSGGSCLQ